jgi:urease gamma subunit
VFKSKTAFIVLGVVGALVLLLGGVGVAYAQWPEPPTGDQPFYGMGQSLGRGAFYGRPFNGMAMRRRTFQDGPFQGLIGIVAEATGLSQEEILDALRDGQTLAEIAEAEGADLEEIVDAAVAAAESRLRAAVEDGRLTEAQMEQALDRLAEELPQRLEQAWQPTGPAGGLLGRFGEGFWTMYDAVAEALGLEPEALFTELHDGKTVADVAEEKGVEMEDVREALQDARAEARKEAIEQAVDEGRLTREQAEWMIEGLEEGFIPGARGLGRGRGSGPGPGGCGRGMGW